MVVVLVIMFFSFNPLITFDLGITNVTGVPNCRLTILDSILSPYSFRLIFYSTHWTDRSQNLIRQMMTVLSRLPTSNFLGRVSRGKGLLKLMIFHVFWIQFWSLYQIFCLNIVKYFFTIFLFGDELSEIYLFASRSIGRGQNIRCSLKFRKERTCPPGHPTINTRVWCASV